MPGGLARQPGDGRPAGVSVAAGSIGAMSRKPIPTATRAAVLAEHGWVCWLCGTDIPQDAGDATWLRLTMDHVIPVVWGGGDDPENLRPAHQSCNSRRNDDEPDPWRLAPGEYPPPPPAHDPEPPRPGNGLVPGREWYAWASREMTRRRRAARAAAAADADR